MLTDAGPLIALVDHNDAAHAACVSLYRAASLPLITTWPCFSEAMHILGRLGGWYSQSLLWAIFRNSGLAIHSPDNHEVRWIRALMEKYRDTPMDLADASLVAAAETLGEHRIFTLDSDFQIYRKIDGVHFEIVP